MNVKVIIPALNEEESIGLVLDAIPRDVTEVIVVDNGSRDRTARVASEHGARVVAEPRRGYGRACLTGIDVAGTCDVVVFVDADFSDHPEEMPSLIAPIARDEADLVIGTRTTRPENRAALLPQARFGNRLAAFLLNRLFGGTTTDLGPFRAVRHESLVTLAMDDEGFGWTVQMQARALAMGMRVVEVPVSYRRRIGVSKITGTVSGTVKAGTKILYTIGREALRR